MRYSHIRGYNGGVAFPGYIFGHPNITLTSLNYMLEINIEQIDEEQVKYTNGELNEHLRYSLKCRAKIACRDGRGAGVELKDYREGLGSWTCVHVSDGLLE